MLNENFCPIFHVGDDVTIVHSHFVGDSYTFTEISKINKLTYKVDGRLFYKDSLDERRKKQKWDRTNYITATTQEQRDVALRRNIATRLAHHNFSKMSLLKLRKIDKIIKEN